MAHDYFTYICFYIELLDFKETTTLQQGLTKMWEWVQQQPNREIKEWKEFEIDKNMYSYWKIN